MECQHRHSVAAEQVQELVQGSAALAVALPMQQAERLPQTTHPPLEPEPTGTEQRQSLVEQAVAETAAGTAERNVGPFPDLHL